MSHSYTWQQPLESALTEMDLSALRRKTSAAEDAIVTRMQEMNGCDGLEEERDALEEAKRTLLLLLEDKLDYPILSSLIYPRSAS